MSSWITDEEKEKARQKAVESVLIPSDDHKIPADAKIVKGFDFDQEFKFDDFINSFLTTGFQATHIGQAIELVNKMRNWRLSDDPLKEDDPVPDMEERKNIKCTIFLGYTSNMISCGVREIIRFLAKHKMIDCIVTSAGGVEEDFIKCLAPLYIGKFDLDGKELRRRGLNRIGNLLIPNSCYVKFEEFINPVLDQMLIEQERDGVVWSPSSIINRLGKEINNEESVYYWCYKNDIPVFCPALTDGSLGDMIYFHSYNHEKKLIVDIATDVRLINNKAVFSKKTGMIILGGGTVKHHICNANLMRNGADFSLFINTGQEFDGSDSGARPDEAVSWGKIRGDAEPVKVYADATIVFPLIVAATFAKK